MQSLNGAARREHGPSRWAFRFERLMLTPLFRLFLRVVLPFAIVLGGALLWLSDDARRESLNLAISDLRRDVATRPEFMVGAMAIDGASTDIAEEIRSLLPITFPISSFDLDLPQMQAQVAELPAIGTVAVRVRPGGILQFNIVERKPVMLWRTHAGLSLVDTHGYVTGPAMARVAYPEMGLIAGAGADQHVQEAMRLFEVAGPLRHRMLGLVRVGERRWDLVLNRDQRIQLPETGAVQALDRVIALNDARELLERDLLVVDMRLASRPTIRLSETAIEDWWQTSAMNLGASGQ